MKGAIFFKEGIWVALGKIASAIAMLLTIQILTSSLTVKDYGELALGLTLCNFITQLVMGALGQGAGRIYIESLESRNSIDFKSALITLLKKSAFILTFLHCTYVAVDLTFFNGYALFFISGLVIFGYLTGVNDIGTSLQNLARNRKTSVFLLNFEVWIRIPAILLLFVSFGKSLEIVVVAYIVSASLAASLQGIFFSKLFHSNDNAINNHNWGAQIMSIAKPASLWGFFIWLYQASDKWMLKFFQSTESVADYAVLYQIGYMPVIIGMGVLSTIYTPIIFKHSGTIEAQIIVRRLLIFLFLAVLAGTFFSVQYGERIIEAVASSKYVSIADYLPWIILSSAIYSAGDIMSIMLMAEKRIFNLMAIKISSSIMGLLLNGFGAYLYGLPGVIGASLLYGIIYTVMICTPGLIRFFNMRKR
jgi:O-antigen/teichoic acid export membrane protein